MAKDFTDETMDTEEKIDALMDENDPENAAEEEAPTSLEPGADEIPNFTPVALEPEVPAQTETPKLGLKKGVIAAIIAGVVVLVAGLIVGTIWLINYQKPENVVLDAITKAIESKAAIVSGGVTMEGKALEDAGIEKIAIGISGESAFLPSESEAALRISAVGGDTFEIKISSVMLVDGVLYLRIDNLVETLNAVVPEELEAFVDYFTEILEEINGTWWRFDAREFGMSVEEKTQYGCAMGALARFGEEGVKKEIATLYRDWPFLNTSKRDKKVDGYDVFDISLDSEMTVNFLNNFRGTGVVKAIQRCAVPDGETVGTEIDEINVPEDFPQFSMKIQPWTHEIKSIDMSYEAEDISIETSVVLDFVESMEVTAPEGSVPVQSLVESVVLKLCEVSGYTVANCPFAVDFGDFSGGGSDLVAGRNVRREADLARFLRAVRNFLSENEGRLPFVETGAGGWTLNENFVVGYIDDTCTSVDAAGRYVCTDKAFKDPDGTTYAFQSAVITDGKVGIAATALDHNVYYAVGYRCGPGEKTVVAGNNRMVSLFMVLEGGKTVCTDNS